MQDKELSILIQNWFNKDISNKWSDSAVGRTIKDNLKSLGNWKNAPRGNPRKAKRLSDRAKYEKEHGKIEDNNENNY